jgi:membrane fusion protein (multidrug efflux system)
VILTIGILILIVAVCFGAVYAWYRSFYESTDDAYIDGHAVSVSARVAGHVLRVHVTANQAVAEGALLVEIDPRDFQVQLDHARAALCVAQANAEQAEAEIQSAKAELDRQKEDLHRYETLAEQDAVARQDLEHSRASARSAEANLNAAIKRAASKQAELSQAQATLEQAALNLSYTKVCAPTAGSVTAKAVEPGIFISVGQPLLALVREDKWVTANYKETQLTSMRPGQPATIKVDAYPGVVFTGHVDSIQAGTGAAFSLFPPENATGNYVKVVQRVPVKIVFDKPPDPNYPLGLGMSVEPQVQIGQVPSWMPH